MEHILCAGGCCTDLSYILVGAGEDEICFLIPPGLLFCPVPVSHMLDSPLLLAACPQLHLWSLPVKAVPRGSPGYQDFGFLGRCIFWFFPKAVLKDHCESSRSDSSKGILGLGHVVDPSQMLPDHSACSASSFQVGSLGSAP